MLMLGYAWQAGRVPLAHASIMRAIELNGVQVEPNKSAFEWGRRCRHDLASVEALCQTRQVIRISKRKTLNELMDERTRFLVDYQDEAYADVYRSFVQKVHAAEASVAKGTRLSEAVARGMFKLMAYKDEYEVARLHTGSAFAEQIGSMFEGDYTIVHHLAPPLLSRHNDKGELVKRAFGPWVRVAMRALGRMKGLRGTKLDLFGYTQERRAERSLIRRYRDSIDEILATLTEGKLTLAVEIANLPQDIRGYGHVKARNAAAANTK